jgi:hypothetical protein
MKQVGTIIKRAFYTLWDEPAARVVARRELEEAKRMYLSNQTAAEYHTQMNIVYRNKIKRLSDFLDMEVPK